MDLRGFGLNDDDLAALGYQVERTSPGEARTRGPGPGGRPIDPSWRMWAATTLVLVVTVWAASSERWLPRPVPGNHPDTAFSSARAMSQLTEIARAPRPMGSPEHARVRANLVGRLEALGLETEVQTVTMAAREGREATAATVRNVVARLSGSASTGAVLLTAHYDGPPLSPAAGDGGAGLVAVLETVRAVTAGRPLRNDLIVVLADGREPGLLGARAFVEHHPWMGQVRVAMSVETWGVSGPSLLVGPEPVSARIARALADRIPAAATVPVPDRILRAAPAPDVSPFREGGATTLRFTATDGRALHGRPEERPAAVREETLQHHGLQLLAMTRALGESDLAEGARDDAEARVRVRLPWADALHYPASRTLPASLALLAAWGLAAFALRQRRSGTRRGVAAGAALGALAVGGAAVVARAVFDRLEALHPEYGRLGSAFYEEGIHLIGLVWLAVAVVTALHALGRLRFGAAELFVGALTLPLVAVVGLGFTEPAAAAPLQWALAPALLAALLLAVSGRGRRPGLGEWLGYVLLAVASLTLIVPVLEVLAGALTLRSAALVAALIAAGALLVLPAGEWLLRPRPWLAPALAAGVAAALLGAGLPSVRGGARHPMPTSLVYLVEQPSAATGASGARPAARATPVRSAMLSSAPTGTAVPDDAPPARRLIGSWLTIPGPGEDWSRSWVAQPPAGSTEPGVLLLPAGAAYEVAGGGPASDVRPPRVVIASDVVEAGWRTLELTVRGGLGGEMLGVHVPEGGTSAIVRVSGAAWDEADGEPVRCLVHWGAPMGGTLRVTLRVEAAREQLELDIVEHHLRPADVLGPGFFERADSVAPDPSTGSDRVVQRSRVVLPLARAGASAAG